MESESSQQFCLRWHNHQSSVLGGLPALLDSGRLTDVTLCAGGRSLRAHRIVLSTCSPYFMDIFKELPPNQQPVIVVLGGGWAELCCLVAFMYAGEVTIPKTLLPGLLKLARALRITGLTDLNGNVPEVPQTDDDNFDKFDFNFSTPSDTTTTPLQVDSASSIENVSPFYKSFQSQLASKQSSHTSSPLTPSSEPNYTNILHDETFHGLQLLKHLSLKHDKETKTTRDDNPERCDSVGRNTSSTLRRSGRSDCKRYLNPVLNEIEPKNRKIDKIVENLKCNQKKSQDVQMTASRGKSHLSDFQKCFMSISAANVEPCQEQAKDIVSSVSKAADIFAGSNIFMETDPETSRSEPPTESPVKNIKIKSEPSPDIIQELKYAPLSLGVHSPTSSKLYATCYVCHKQLSNQYNLRVHLETHQNIRHACVACNHVSRSRDALRKHVSYRHPQLNTSHVVGRPCKPTPTQANTPNTLQTPGTTTSNVFNFPDPRCASETIDLSATNARSGHNSSVTNITFPYESNEQNHVAQNSGNTSDKKP